MSEPAIVVTGAASGIGRATAERLRDAGRHVIGVDRDAAGAPDGVDCRACDLSDPRAIDALAKALPDRLGGLANVAGLPGTQPPERIFAVNVLAPRRLATALMGRIEPGGAIVNVASVAQFRSSVAAEEIDRVLATDDDADVLAWLTRAGLDGTQAYDTSKQALVALTRLNAKAGARSQVRALSVSPGPVQTPILDDFRTSMGASSIDAAEGIVGRHGQPDEIAAVIAFLLSAEARWVNAIDVLVDGGLLGIR